MIDAPEGHPLRLAPGLFERRGAIWGKGSPMEEALSVLSVYSPQGYYVDIRVRRADGPGPLTATESRLDDTLSEDLDWAFGGQVRVQIQPPSHEPSQGEAESVTTGQSAWTRTIDSNLTDSLPDNEVDRATLTLQSDGSILEVGQIPDAETGEEIHFEEVWLRLSRGSSSSEGACVVYGTEDLGSQTRGLVVRYGGWSQGILRGVKEGLTVVERWRVKENGNEGEENEYVKDFKLGSSKISLPCREPATGKSVGMTFEVDGLTWKVLELVE